MRVKEALSNTNEMYNAIENEENMTDEIKQKYGYVDYYWTRNHYDSYRANSYLGITRSDRNQITKTFLKEIKMFLEEATKYGFIGDMEIKANWEDGMWACSRTGSAEEKLGCTYLYYHFESGNKYFQIQNEMKRDITGRLNKKELKEYINKLYGRGENG